MWLLRNLSATLPAKHVPRLPETSQLRPGVLLQRVNAAKASSVVGIWRSKASRLPSRVDGSLVATACGLDGCTSLGSADPQFLVSCVPWVIVLLLMCRGPRRLP